MAKDSDYSKIDLVRLRADFEEERKIKETLEESVSDLRSTMHELQERLHGVDGEGNEWKTRFETQVELNGQLERQISLVHERLESIRGKPMDRLASIRSYDDMSEEMLKKRLKLLTEERLDLQTQLRNCHLQIEQEGKAFHKTNDERRAYLSEIAMLSSTHEAHRRQFSTQQQRAPGRKQSRKQTSRKTEADSKKGKGGEEHGGGEHLKGGGGSDSAIERREERKSLRQSKLPSIKHYLKHNP